MSLPEPIGRVRVGRSSPRADKPAVRPTRRLRIVVAAVTAAILVSACADGSGFKPLYGATGGETYDQRLAKVDVAPISGRVGQRIRNELVFQRSTGQQAEASEYRLDIVMTESVLTTLVSSSGSSSSQVYQLEARYQLVDAGTKKKVFEGRSLGRGSFDRFASIYSNVRAREDAENRVAKSLADDIRTRVLAYLATKPS